MGNVWIMLIVGIGVGTWAGKQFYHRTGGNFGKSAGAGLIAGLIAGMITLSLLWLIG